MPKEVFSWFNEFEVPFRDIIKDAEEQLAKAGIFLGELEDLDTCGVRYCSIAFRGVSVDLENKELQKTLSEASQSWERLFRALAFEKLVSDKSTNVCDYVEVKEIFWSRRNGPVVRLNVSMEVDKLLQRYSLGEADAGEMEEALEGILDYEARRILKRLNEELAAV